MYTLTTPMPRNAFTSPKSLLHVLRQQQRAYLSMPHTHLQGRVLTPHNRVRSSPITPPRPRLPVPSALLAIHRALPDRPTAHGRRAA